MSDPQYETYERERGKIAEARERQLAAAIGRGAKLDAEIARLRAALDPFVRHAHCTDQIERSSLVLWCAQALNAVHEQEGDSE